MAFRPLCTSTETSLQALGDVALRVVNSTVAVFSGYVLPHRTVKQPTFTDDDCELYVADRTWNAGFPIPDEYSAIPNKYELLLDQLFWADGLFGKDIDDKKVVFITGSVGSGKSTFVDYYLRCYCPTRSIRKDLFNEKLILHFDLKGRQSASEIDSRIWRDMKNSLKRAGLEPEKFGEFSSKVSPNHDTINWALQEISAAAAKSSLGAYKYIVLVFDNIDQSPIACQRHCLSIIQDIVEVESGIDVWKVIFPMWPETLNRLNLKSGFTSKGVEYHEIDLGRLNLQDFYERRRGRLEKEFATSADSKTQKILNEVRGLTTTRYADFLRDLTYGNMVVLDKIVVGLLLSEEVQKHQEQSGHHNLSDYRFFDSLICGSSRFHNRKKSKIMNPFFWRSNIGEVNHTFVVAYLMSYLQNGRDHQVESVLNFFSGYGFPRGLIREAITTMEEFNLLHFEDKSTINPHRTSLAAYEKLISEPAVVDNFAMTTPILASWIDVEWKKTRGYDPLDFYNRCRTTRRFFSVMSKMEDMIDTEVERIGRSSEKFRQVCPRWVHKALPVYYDRLVALKDLGWPAEAHMTEAQWSELLK